MLVEDGTVACSSLCPPALVSQAIHEPCVWGLYRNPSTCTWVVLIYVSGSCPDFPAHISLPQQSTQPNPVWRCPALLPPQTPLLCAADPPRHAGGHMPTHPHYTRVLQVAVCP